MKSFSLWSIGWSARPVKVGVEQFCYFRSILYHIQQFLPHPGFWIMFLLRFHLESGMKCNIFFRCVMEHIVPTEQWISTISKRYEWVRVGFYNIQSQNSEIRYDLSPINIPLSIHTLFNKTFANISYHYKESLKKMMNENDKELRSNLSMYAKSHKLPLKSWMENKEMNDGWTIISVETALILILF